MKAPGARREKGKMNMIGNETALSSTPRASFVFPEVCESSRLRVRFWLIIASRLNFKLLYIRIMRGTAACRRLPHNLFQHTMECQ